MKKSKLKSSFKEINTTSLIQTQNSKRDPEFEKQTQNQICARFYDPTSGQSGLVGKSWPDGFETTPKFSFSDPIQLIWLTYVGLNFNPTQHIGLVKDFFTYSKFPNPIGLVRRTDVGSDFYPTLHVGIVKKFLTRSTFSNPTRLTRPTDCQILTLPDIQEL